jgi:hypothetical protein
VRVQDLSPIIAERDGEIPVIRTEGNTCSPAHFINYVSSVRVIAAKLIFFHRGYG